MLPCHPCDRLRLGRGNLRANGHPSDGPWRQFHCTSCKGYFLETHGTIFHGKHAAVALIVHVLACLAEGLGIRATARVFEVAPTTVLQWLVEAAEQLRVFSAYFLCDLHVEQLQLDELYAVLRARKAGEISEDAAIKRLERAPYWVWTAMDPTSKLLVVIDVGSRTLAMAQCVVHQVTRVLVPGCVPLFLTDGLKEYATALLSHFGHWTSSSKWTICSGEIEVAQSPDLLRSYNPKSYLYWLSERISFVTDQNAEEKTLILQASSPAVSTTLFDSSHAQRLQNQSVYAEVACRFSLYRSFLSLYYRRSWSARTIDSIDRTEEQFFTRWNARHPEHGGARKDPTYSHMGSVYASRQLIADVINLHLEKHDHAARVDPRSLEDRGIDREPERKLRPSDSYALKHRYELTPDMATVMQQRHAHAPSRGAEQAHACTAWEARKQTLGITPAMDLSQALERVRESRDQAVHHKPARQPIARTLSPHELALTTEIGRLEQYQQQLTTEIGMERLIAQTGQTLSLAGRQHVEQLLGEGKAHGIPEPAQHRTRGPARVLDALSVEEQPRAGLRMKLREQEREQERDEGMSMGFGGAAPVLSQRSQAHRGTGDCSIE